MHIGFILPHIEPAATMADGWHPAGLPVEAMR